MKETGLKKDEETGDFLYGVVVLGPHAGPFVVENRLPVDDGLVDCRALPYREAKRVAPELRERGYEVRFPDKPWHRKMLERLGFEL